MKKQLMLLVLILGSTGALFAQEREVIHPLTISGYAEVYYNQDFNRPLNNSRPAFIYSHNRTNEVNLNLAFIKANYNTARVRANLTIATGTYMNANYAAELGVLKNLYEANIGVKISKKHDLWIEAGLLPSHIGFESAIGADNWTLTRGLYAENSPYFETGVKIAYTTPSGKWLISGLMLNGWQRIQRVDGNTTPAFGHQLIYKPHDKITLNSSSFIGNDQPDSLRRMRYFHNLYAIYQVSDKWGVTIGFDIGAEQKEKGSSDYNTWYTPVLIAKYALTERFSLSARGEYYQDKAGLIIDTALPKAFRVFGYSLNVDYRVLPHVLWRTEVRNLASNDKVFLNRNLAANSSFTAVTTIAVGF